MTEAYQYALWRVVPDAQRGECVNVGVVLYCPRRRFLAARADLDEARLKALDPGLDLDAVALAIGQRAAVAAGESDAGALAALPPSERFGSLVAPSSTTVQPGPVHTGLSNDPAATLDDLFERLVRASSTE